MIDKVFVEPSLSIQTTSSFEELPIPSETEDPIEVTSSFENPIEELIQNEDQSEDYITSVEQSGSVFVDNYDIEPTLKPLNNSVVIEPPKDSGSDIHNPPIEKASSVVLDDFYKLYFKVN